MDIPNSFQGFEITNPLLGRTRGEPVWKGCILSVPFKNIKGTGNFKGKKFRLPAFISSFPNFPNWDKMPF